MKRNNENQDYKLLHEERSTHLEYNAGGQMYERQVRVHDRLGAYC